MNRPEQLIQIFYIFIPLVYWNNIVKEEEDGEYKNWRLGGFIIDLISKAMKMKDFFAGFKHLQKVVPQDTLANEEEINRLIKELSLKAQSERKAQLFKKFAQEYSERIQFVTNEEKEYEALCITANLCYSAGFARVCKNVSEMEISLFNVSKLSNKGLNFRQKQNLYKEDILLIQRLFILSEASLIKPFLLIDPRGLIKFNFIPTQKCDSKLEILPINSQDPELIKKLHDTSFRYKVITNCKHNFLTRTFVNSVQEVSRGSRHIFVTQYSDRCQFSQEVLETFTLLNLTEYNCEIGPWLRLKQDIFCPDPIYDIFSRMSESQNALRAGFYTTWQH
ncbi:hypothetical protein FGO68_gene10784 [Halteria grandinella]|uniref:Uncharacterized protein n=1 Tax=Halteria grandinella TaxID=5974 RepID=A0A8J8NTP0_HALGN|nr:hypothetical protein FGO68_gene10784 [Halteria grandinella]